MDGVSYFDASAVTASIVVSGVADAVLVHDRHGVDLGRSLNVDRDARTSRALSQRVPQERRDRQRSRRCIGRNRDSVLHRRGIEVSSWG